MKKTLSILFLSFLLLITSVYAADSSEKEIRSLIKEHNSALTHHNTKKLATFYDTNYRSIDGFSLDEMIKMVKDASDAFKNLKYSTKIDSIEIDDNLATVKIQENTKAKIYPVKKKDKRGILDGYSKYTMYLKKENNTWKIVKEDILEEQTTLKYGLARRIKFDLITPNYIENGKDYDLSLKIDKPRNVLALGAISNEEIKLPNENYNEKFRKISPDGELERVVKANANNKNEYALASVGYTKITLREKEKKIRIQILGVAYIIKRINMINKTNSEVLVNNNG